MIVTHQNPDWDAICGVWLLKRFVNTEVEVKFINTGNPDETLLNQAMAVVDTGKEFNPLNWRFDHHQLTGNDSNLTCATEQVYLHLLNLNYDIGYLKSLIELIYWGDTGKSEANFSRELGLHALLSGFKKNWADEHGVKFTPDDEVLNFGFQILDIMNTYLKSQSVIKAELAEKVVYKSKDGLLWAIKHGSSGSSFAAFDEGARLVVFEGKPVEVEGGTTYPIGIMRAGEWNEPNCGKLVSKILDDYLAPHSIRDELRTWFNHNSGFFSGRGTPKAPMFEPIQIDLEHLAHIVDVVWER